MPNSTREVRNGKPSRLAKGLLVASMLTFLGGCRITPEGRNFINSMGYTAAGTFIQESVSKEVWGNGQENYSQGQRQPNNSRRLIYAGERWTYWENNSSVKAKIENGTFYRSQNGQWVPVPNGTPVFR